MLILVAGFGMIYLVIGLYLYRRSRIWINPINFVLLYYFFNYPIRAALLLAFPETFNTYSFNDPDILLGLAYSTLYVIVFVGTYLLLLRLFHVSLICPPLERCSINPTLFYISGIIVLLSGSLVLSYEVSTGGSFSLGQDIEELRRPSWVNALGVFSSLKWFSICFGVLTWLRTRSSLVAFLTMLILLMTVYEGILSTGKGFIFTLLLLFFFIDNFLTGRSVRLPVVGLAATAAILFSSYSYYSRYFIGFGSEAVGGIDAMYDFFSRPDILAALEENLELILDRGTYYLDGLLLMLRDGVAVAPGLYIFGSLVEVINIIPYASGLVAEQYSFDRHVTEAVWGSWGFSQIFIGRIGESFFVLGYFGIFVAFVNAAIFALVAGRWASASKTLSGISLYFAVLVSWLYQDASIFYQAKVLLYMLFSYQLIKTLSKLLNMHGHDRKIIR